ncbi:MAG: phospholipase [Streptomycetaceae bacterium]|nr:phospholipase [Streptomycetaceae bacterium]
MGERIVRSARRAATTAAALLTAVTVALSPAHAAESPAATTDRLLFGESLARFVATRAAADRPGTVDWSSDGCSTAPDAPLGYDFLQACWRHDFGYRNYKAQGRFTEAARLRIDDRFHADMYTLCGGRPLCRATADLYYEGVRRFGG